ncbi:MAG: protease SohB [Vicinamibacterales bacterium]
MAEYFLFLAKVVTLLLAVVTALAVSVRLMRRQRPRYDGRLEIKHVNRRYERLADAVQSAVLSRRDARRAHAARKKSLKVRDAATPRPRLFVVDFHGDIRGTAVASLREEITAILLSAREGDSVLVRLESGGGQVHAYGLAASQLTRLKSAGVRLTVAVDKVAASGGYLMACVADRIVAAPFAIVGSIGVVAAFPNFNRALKRNDIDFEQFTAGRYKRTVTMFAENSDADRDKFQSELEDVHHLFQEFVKTNRPSVDIDAVATGEHWYGTRALTLGLVDELRTSDDLLLDARERFEILELIQHRERQMASWFREFLEQRV